MTPADYLCKWRSSICFWIVICLSLSFSQVWMMWCVDVCWWRWLKWMWFDFSLKLSTQSVRLNSSLRSFISFSEMKKKLQSLHWERKRSRRSRWWRRSWRRWTDTSQLFHTQSKTRRRWWEPVTSAFWRSDSRSLIDRLLIDWLIDDWLSCWWSMVCLFCRSFQSQWKGEWSAAVSASDQRHCSSDPECSSRVQISSQPDPQMPSGALIHVPRYLGNLPFRVWKKMQDIVQNSESDCRRSELHTHTLEMMQYWQISWNLCIK